MLNQRTYEACPIDYMEALGNIYQTCRPKGKTYRDAQLRELVHSVTIEYVPEHEVVYESKLTGEKHEEGETATEWQPPRP
jgi:hypothetical protein